MSRPTLYLMLGYPGAGKTTVARIIHEATGAVHLWSDIERHKMFDRPTHSETESVKLYDELNRRAGAWLTEGRSVVFDTTFNFREDRHKLKSIADRAGADAVVLWVEMPVEEARSRSVGTGQRRNGYHTRMTGGHFDELAAKLEAPGKDEKVIKIDGLKLDRQTVLSLLNQYHDAGLPLT